MPILDRIRTAWNAFRSEEASAPESHIVYGASYSGVSQHKTRFRVAQERSVVSSIYNTISVDASGMPIRHTRVDELERYTGNVPSGLDNCLTFEANIDQGPRAFKQDAVMTMIDHGVVAIVADKTSVNPATNPDFDIYSLRVGNVVNWFPRHVTVSLYNDEKGFRQDVTLPKRSVCIVENPFYAVMNAPNSTLQRLIRKFQLLDVVDEASSSGKLDLIIQLPYTIRSETKRQQAEQRKADIEMQLVGSKYGIAYTDGTEKITQLNRPAENNLLEQVEFLKKMLYEQLGVTPAVMDGSADEAAMTNYYSRTIGPILDALVQGMTRSFIGPNKHQSGERVQYFKDPFKFVAMKDIADIADKFARNEIMTSNEIRGAIGIPPHSDPKADKLVNSNMPQNETPVPSSSKGDTMPQPEDTDPSSSKG